MRDYLEPMLGTTGAMIASFAIILVGLAIAILLVLWLIRSFTSNRLGASAPRGRQPRLSVLDALPIDQKRRLVLIRRDNVEHLILIGGPTDIVVEPAIHRSSAAQRRAEAAARTNGQQQRYAAEAPRAEPAYAAYEAVAPEPDTRPPVDDRRSEPRRQGFVRDEPALQQQPELEPAPLEQAPQEFAPEETVAEPQQQPIREAERAEAIQRIVEVQRVEEVRYEEPVAEPEPVMAPAPEPLPPVVPPRPLTPKPLRAATAFLGQVGRSRTAAEPATEVADEPRRPEPPARPLGRATPLAPKAPEPPPAEPVDVAPEVEAIEPDPVRAAPVRPEPVRAEPVRTEPSRPAPRAPMPPAPPVAPPSMGDAPYGAPNTDPDAPPRFEPIFDIDPNDARDPGRPVRPAREPSFAAPSIAPQRSFTEETAEVTIDPADRVEPEDRGGSVGDLEKEMARLLGEISGSRRS